MLARYGVRSVLIHRKDTFNDGAARLRRAAKMHILERIGAVAPFLEKALGWRFGRSYYRGEQIFRLEMPQPPGEKYLPMYNLQQQYIEQSPARCRRGERPRRHALAERIIRHRAA